MSPFKAYREAHGLRQRELAERLGMSLSYVQAVESGHRQVTALRAIQFEQLTGGGLGRATLRPDLWHQTVLSE